MPGCARLGDICSGTGGPSRPNIEASTDTLVNGLGIHRQGDAWDLYGYLVSGSPNVIVNGKQCGRWGDPVSCGSVVITCSSDVIIN